MRFKIHITLLILAAALTAGWASAQEPTHFTHGPILGRLSAHGVGVWARTARTAEFTVRYGLTPENLDQVTRAVPTRLERDNTGWVHITGLKPNTLYYYELVLPEAAAALEEQRK